MLFNSIQFAIFLPIVFAIYWLLGKNLKLQNIFVVVASYVFYGWWDWRFLTLIALTSFLSWGSGLLIANASNTPPCGYSYKKMWLGLNIAINLMILGAFKYYNFFVDSFCSLFGLVSSPFAISLILPVGISFYTFQALSYSIDVYRGNIKPTRDLVAFFAYVSFFPQLVAGPIERATNLLPQFEKPREFNYGAAVDGCRRILWGLFKKIVVADNCARYVNLVWDNYANECGSTLALAAVLFAFQIYGDFSGYSDIAIGTAKLFDINLKDNFLTPYFSRNVAEFWKRWHISLNTWFVDYVYLPLGGDGRHLAGKNEDVRSKNWIKIRNTYVIFLLSGLWHGANWTYVGWGLYHALLFVPLILLGQTKKYKGVATWREIPQMVFVFVLVCIGWVIFRAPSIADAWNYMASIVSSIGNLSFLQVPWLMTRDFYMPLFASIIVMMIVEWTNREGSYGLYRLFGGKFMQSIIYLLIWFVIYYYVIMSGENHNFIYFQF